MTRQQDRQDLLDRIIEGLDGMYSYLRRASASEHIQRRGLVNRAVGMMMCTGLRQLKAARDDVRHGWAAESFGHVRTGWESGIDVAFLLSTGGDERAELAEQYLAMMMLRTPRLDEFIAESPDRFADWFVETYHEWKPKYSGSQALDPRSHWSGRDKGSVRLAAYTFLDGLDDGRIRGLAKHAKLQIFEEQGSTVVHADPGAAAWLESDDAGWPLGGSVDSSTSSGIAEYEAVTSAAIVGLQLLFGAACRGGRSERTSASGLVEDLLAALRQDIAEGSKA